MKQPKNRSVLFVERSNHSEPVEFDYAEDISEEDLEAMERSNPKNIGKEGIVISGEPW